MLTSFILAAVVYGSLFGLMAIGLTLTYMTTKVPNFAYGSFVTIGLYCSYTLVRIYHLSPYTGTVFAFVLSGVASVAMYLGVLRPMTRRGSSLVSLMIATFGVDIGFIGVFGVYTDYLQKRYLLIDAKQFFQLQPDPDLGSIGLSDIHAIMVIAPLTLAVITASLYLLFTRTKFGVAMRASVENPPLARVLGINVDRVYIVSWMLAGGFAGLAGALYTLWLPGGTSTGSNLIVEIFSSSVLGGLTSIFGAIIGGLIIGMSEDLVTIGLAQGFGYVGAALITAFALLVGGYSFAKFKVRSRRIGGAILIAIGAYMVVEMVTGFSADLFVQGLVSGFGANVTPFQKAIPLMIMVFTLLVLPTGLVSINYRKLLRMEKK